MWVVKLTLVLVEYRILSKSNFPSDLYSFFLKILKKNQLVSVIYIFKDFIYLLSEKEEGREKERERNISCLSHAPRDLARNPGMYPTRN